MPLGLTAAQKSYAGPIVWALEVTSRAGVLYRFAEDLIALGGATYLPYLRISQGPKFTRTLQVDSADVELVNSDLFVGKILAADKFEGAPCDLKQILVGLGQTITRIHGRLTGTAQDDDAVKFRVTQAFDPSQIPAQMRDYSQLCTWRFSKPLCGYDGASMAFTEQLAEQTADIFSSNTIGKAALTMTVNAHADRYVVITAGTGKGQKRKVKSNTATTLTLYGLFAITPDGTSKFKVFSFTAGAPKFLFTSASSLAEATADVFTARTIGYTGLAMGTDDHLGDVVRITAGTGAGQQKKIKTNSATAITLDDAELNFAPVPDGTSVFRVLFRTCPKDVSVSCEIRARTESFNGFPTLVPSVQQAAAAGAAAPPAPVGPIGGGGGIGTGLGPIGEGVLRMF
jgi:hypothetical protein